MRLSYALCIVFVLGASMTYAAEHLVAAQPAEFAKLVSPDAKLEKLAAGFQFIEGPVWMSGTGDGDGYLIFSDIPANMLRKYEPGKGAGTFRKPSHNANGNTLDREGRLVSCEHGSRSVTLTEKDGTVRTLVDSYQGKKLNSPNDVAVKSDGTIWFTDPDYGLEKRKAELDKRNVFCFDPATGQLQIVASDFQEPNGLCFSPDESKLYIAESWWKDNHYVKVYDVQPDHTLRNGRIFCRIDKGVPDGMRVDADGRLWSSAGDGIQIFGTDGKLIGRILVPETPANLCFAPGGMLYITAQKSLYRIHVNVGPAAPKLASR